MSKKRGLGSKGLGIEAMINGVSGVNNSGGGNSNKSFDAFNGFLEVPIDKIEPNKNQPRKYFDEESLIKLAESLSNYGMLQPIIVKKNNDGEYYEIIAGERRWRAGIIAGLEKIPVREQNFNEAERFQVALVENIQREALNPMEEAESYSRLRDEYNFNQEKIAELVGRSRTSITNSLRLLNLDQRVIQLIRDERISEGHGRTLLGISDSDKQYEMAQIVIDEELSVRSTEKLVKAYNKQLADENKPKEEEENDHEFSRANRDAIEESLKNIFSTKVKLNHGKNKGKIEISYQSEDELDRLICIIKQIEGE